MPEEADRSPPPDPMDRRPGGPHHLVDVTTRETAVSEPTEPESTGLRPVDEVLKSLDRLDELPVEEHVAVYESAHDGLRAALADVPPSPRP
jgi:hypothetical protein